MSDERIVEGAAFTDAEVERLAALMQHPDFALWERILWAIRSAVSDQGMGMPGLSDRQLWECRGAYQQLKQIVSVRAALERHADEIAKAKAAKP